jgi:hypothetical protein
MRLKDAGNIASVAVAQGSEELDGGEDTSVM